MGLLCAETPDGLKSYAMSVLQHNACTCLQDRPHVRRPFSLLHLLNGKHLLSSLQGSLLFLACILMVGRQR